jgi:ketosteroid isomerase-like protein
MCSVPGKSERLPMRWLLGAFAVVCVLLSGGALAQPAPAAAQQAIRPLMVKMLDAANAHDAGAFMAFMVKSPHLITVVNGEIFHGWKHLHAQQVKWWHAGHSDVRYAQNGKPDFMALGRKTVLVTWPLASRRALPDGTVSRSNFVVSYVWQKLPSGWRITYGHESSSKAPD